MPLNIGDLADRSADCPGAALRRDRLQRVRHRFIQQYGYLDGGVLVGSGVVGGASEINRQDFYRESYQVGYDWLFGTNVNHELHVGYQWYKDEEVIPRPPLERRQHQHPGGRITSSGQPVYFQAQLLQTGVTGLGVQVPNIHSEFESQSVEVNDTIRWDDWTFNVGLLLSKDTLYGQACVARAARRRASSLPDLQVQNVRGRFRRSDPAAPGRDLGLAPEGTVYANARFNPAASPPPARGVVGAQPGGDPHRQLRRPGQSDRLSGLASPSSGKSSGRGSARDATGVPDRHLRRKYIVAAQRLHRSLPRPRTTSGKTPTATPGQSPRTLRTTSHELYIPDLRTCSRASRFFLRHRRARQRPPRLRGGGGGRVGEKQGCFSSRVPMLSRSHYDGNFSTRTTPRRPDRQRLQHVHLGSSNLADGPGRQLWDSKYGNLHGDRRHQLKLFGYYR